MYEQSRVYWQKQGTDQLCAVHTINSLLQGPFFNQISLSEFGLELDKKEKQLMGEQGVTKEYLKFMQQQSGNVAMSGNYSIQVLEAALKTLNLSLTSIETLNIKQLVQKKAFIFNSSAHWFVIRKIDDIWYNFNSCSKRMPELISDFYLEAFMMTVKNEGYQIFSVQGKFPQSSEDKFDFYNKNQLWIEKKRIKKYHQKCIKRKGYKPNINGAGNDKQMDKAMAMSLGIKYEPYESSGEDQDWDDNKEKKLNEFGGMGVSFQDEVFVNYQKFTFMEDEVQIATSIRMSLADMLLNQPENGKTVLFRFPNNKKQMRKFPLESTVENLYDYIWVKKDSNQKFYLLNYSNKERLIDVTIPIFALEDEDGDISVMVTDQ